MAEREDLEFTYSLIDRVFRLSLGELADFSGAKYDGDFSLSLEEAQRRKHAFLAEQIGIGPGRRVLDLGCGWGPLLDYVRSRRGTGVGVTLSSAHHVGVAAEPELRIDQLLERGEAKLFETGDLALGEALVRGVGERRAAPERQRTFERGGGAVRVAGGELIAAGGHEVLESVGVEVLALDRQLVAALARHDRARAGVVVTPSRRERLSQSRDLDVQELGGRGRRPLAPQLVDQPVRGERLVGVQQQQGEQRSLPAPAERNRPALVEDLERTEDVEVHEGWVPGGANNATPGAEASARRARRDD